MAGAVILVAATMPVAGVILAEAMTAAVAAISAGVILAAAVISVVAVGTSEAAETFKPPWFPAARDLRSGDSHAAPNVVSDTVV